jgi:hypothetical protein
MTQDPHAGTGEVAQDEIERAQTGLRIALTVLFVLIGTVIESAIAVIVVFELAVTLATRRPPSRRVRELANRIISYYYRIGRYLTYNASRPPFPFSDFPEAVEPDDWRAADRESDALGLDWREREPVDEDE